MNHDNFHITSYSSTVLGRPAGQHDGRIETPANGFSHAPGEVGKDAPVPLSLVHRRRVVGGGLADASMMEFRAEGCQTGFDVPQTLSPCKWGESQHAEPFVSRQPTRHGSCNNGRDSCRTRVGVGSREDGRRRCDLRSYDKKPLDGVEGSQRIVAKFKLKKRLVAKKRRFHGVEIAVSKNLTG